MAQKTLNTRIQNRLDTLSNWKAEGVSLLPGEIALVSVTTQQVDPTSGNVVNVPAVLMKVGENDAEGNPKAFSALPWLSAKAADVYAWAKEQHAENVVVKELISVDDEGNETWATDGKTLKEWAHQIESNTSRIAAIEAKFSGENSIESRIDAIVGENGLIATTAAQTLRDALAQASNQDTVVLSEAQKYTDEKAGANAEAIEELSIEVGSLKVSVTGGVHYVGTVTEVPESGTVTINGSTTHVAVAGDMVIYTANHTEYIYNGESWEELGDPSGVNARIDALDHDNGEYGAHKFATKVIQTNGLIDTEYAQPVAADVLYESGSTDTVHDKIDGLAADVAAKADAEHNHAEYENQNAFSAIKVGDATIEADAVTDTVELVAGNNITIAADAENDKVTFSVADATDSVKGVTLLGKEGGAATYEAVDAIEGQVAAIESNYLRIGDDNNMYAGTSGADVIIFNCGNASSWMAE